MKNVLAMSRTPIDESMICKADVARMMAEKTAARPLNIMRPSHQARPIVAAPVKAGRKRPVQSAKPKMDMTIAVTQYCSMGFSMYGM